VNERIPDNSKVWILHQGKRRWRGTVKADPYVDIPESDGAGGIVPRERRRRPVIVEPNEQIPYETCVWCLPEEIQLA
jgi:hypothetical protein